MAGQKYGWHSEFGVVSTNSIWMADEKYYIIVKDKINSEDNDV